MFSRIFRTSVVMLLFSCLAFAQADRGTLTGTVSDPQGAVVPGVKITVRNTQNGSEFETVSTSTGNYTVAQLPASSYEVVVEAQGFKKYTQTGIAVGVAQTARIDVVLQIGATTDSVTVNADAPLLKTEGAEQSFNIATERMNDLPLNFGARGPGSLRNPFTFVVLIPGGNITDRNNIRVNGMPNVTFGIRLEGQDQSRPLDPNNSDMVAPSVEAVQEISLQTSNFAAEYGQVAGGLFNFTTKSGSNMVHGSAYGYFVNEGLHAGRAFTDNGAGGHIRAKDRKLDYGVSLGGPVVLRRLYNGRNKTFFFANIEKYVNRGNISGNFATLPIQAFRDGDFSSILTGRRIGTDRAGRAVLENTLFDPASTRTVNGISQRDPFVGNRIPVSRFDPVAAKIQAYIPLPTLAGLIQNWEQKGSTVRKNELTSIKIDHSVSDRHKISFYLQYYRAKFGNNGADGLAPPVTAKRLGGSTTPTVRLNYDFTVTPTMILHLGAGVVREHVPDEAVPGVNDFDQVGVLGLRGALSAGFPRITGLSQGNFGGLSLGIGPTNANQYYAVKPTGVASLSWIKGNHSYKFGGEWKIDAFINQNRLNTYGAYAFGNQQTSDPALQGVALTGGSVGHGYASFLLGASSQATIANPQDPHYRKTSWGFFAQDTWKFTRKLTFDYGLRWDYQEAFREQWDRFSAFDPNRPNPTTANLPGATSYEGYGNGRCNCRFAATYPWAFGPRLGAAYQINSKTVLRIGGGVTYGQTSNFNYVGTTVGTGYNTLNVTSTTFGEPATLFRNGLNYDRNLLFSASLDPGIRPTAGQIDAPSAWVDPDGGRPARIMQWSIGLQREVTRDLVVEASYVGNRGAWFQANSLIDLNALTPERITAAGLNINNAADRTLLTSTINSALSVQRGFNRLPYPGFPTGQTVAQSLRPFPQFGNLASRWSPLGNNWYDSLQVKVTKRRSHGLDLSAAFTWQKELVRGSDDQGGGGGNINDVFNRANQKSISGNSQPLVFVTAFNYEIPTFAKNKFLRQIAGGWTIGGIVRYATGLPILVPGSQNALNALLFRGTRMNRVSGQPLFSKDLDCHCIDPNKELTLNPAAWTDAAAGQWGVSAPYYNDYRANRRPDEQINIGRIFRIRERYTLQLRGEFFNAFNRLILAAPSSGNPFATTTTSAGRLTGGFGWINPLSSGSPRNGQVVLRFQF
jgi:Carboxypeptidase regulatory-like domain/TonB dependent receptor